jgi:hypothetical protein
MSNTYATNYSILTYNDQFQFIWKLTRVLLAAGWKYKASSDNINKDISNCSNYTVTNGSNIADNLMFGGDNQDKWQVGGAVNATTLQTITNGVIGTPSNYYVTITPQSGSFTFNPTVGHYVSISGAAFSQNNGIYLITSVSTNVSLTIYSPGALNNDANNGSITVNEIYGGSLSSGSFTVNPTFGSATMVGYTLVSGVSGLVQPLSTAGIPGSVGHRLTITGATSSANNGSFLITNWISSTSCIIQNPYGVSESGGVNTTWTEWDPNSSTYPIGFMNAPSSVNPWICLQGPSTLKMPIGTNLPSENFIRGEQVVQDNTNATAEVLGVVTDVNTGLGFMVLLPRLNGIGSDIRGWSLVDTVRGNFSGAAVSPLSSGTLIEFAREFVWWRYDISRGHMYMQTVDTIGESSPGMVNGRFSQMATLSQCTATVCPGGATGSPNVNGFPSAGTWCINGKGGATVAGTGCNYWICGNSQDIATGNAQILAANCIEGVMLAPDEATAIGVTADGSWVFAAGTPLNAPTTYACMAFQRVDDCEDGDVDPYVFWTPANSNGAFGRTPATNTVNRQLPDQGNIKYISDSTQSHFIGWRRRGLPSTTFLGTDQAQEFMGFCLFEPQTGAAIASVPTSPESVACNTVTIRVREPIWVASYQVSGTASYKMRKGTLRWIYMIQGNQGNTTYDNMRWIQLSSTVIPLIAGPFDQVTSNPTNVPV